MPKPAPANPRLPQISDAEWEVMKVLWDRDQASAQDVVDALAAARNWSPQTVKTLLRRLTEKGAVTYQAEGRKFIYRPAIARDAAEKSESRSFLARVFDGAVTPALLHLLQLGRLTRDDIEQLKKTLDQKK
jgi:BlaI family transcriptional regulator, penicillinase repressor